MERELPVNRGLVGVQSALLQAGVLVQESWAVDLSIMSSIPSHVAWFCPATRHTHTHTHTHTYTHSMCGILISN